MTENPFRIADPELPAITFFVDRHRRSEISMHMQLQSLDRNDRRELYFARCNHDGQEIAAMVEIPPACAVQTTPALPPILEDEASVATAMRAHTYGFGHDVEARLEEAGVWTVYVGDDAVVTGATQAEALRVASGLAEERASQAPTLVVRAQEVG